MKVLRIAIAVIVVALVLVFMFYNSTKVTVVYFTLRFENMPLWLVVFISLFIGAFVAWLFMFIDEIGLKRKLKERDKEIKSLKEEINQLRQLTISSK